MPYEEQVVHFKLAKRLLEEISGLNVIGVRLPYSRFNDKTHKALTEAGFKYDSSMRADEKPNPFYLRFNGTSILEIPWFDTDDVLIDERGLSPVQMVRIWSRALKRARPGDVYVFDLHPIRIGMPPYTMVLRDLLSIARDLGLRVLCLEDVYRMRHKLGDVATLVISGDIDCLRVWDFVLRIVKLA